MLRKRCDLPRGDVDEHDARVTLVVKNRIRRLGERDRLPSGDQESVDSASPVAMLSVPNVSCCAFPPVSLTTKRCAGRGRERSVIGSVVKMKLSRKRSAPLRSGFGSAAV